MSDNVTLLEARLRSERPRFFPSDGFTERVLDKLPARPERFQKTAEPRGWNWPKLLIVSAGAICLTLAATQVLLTPRQEAASANVTNVTLENLTEAAKLPALSAAQMEEWTAKLDEPLQKELKNVISDTRQAIQFVASNFLPEN